MLLVVAASIFDLVYVHVQQKKMEQAKIQSAHMVTGKAASDAQKKPPCPGEFFFTVFLILVYSRSNSN